ncbi:MAG: BrnT family toxin [Proteobacteria bacterium]|nr:BrnT family toxin [Pseudomonadota bacterium]MBU4449044.1 BrnT family toxin [Pseudomonadota bacterium]
MLFEWDPNKTTENLEIHGVSFDEAGTAFRDTLSLATYDPLHSEAEDRFVLLGNSHKDRLLVVVHTARGDNIRLISARKASKKERTHYEENVKRSGPA